MKADFALVLTLASLALRLFFLPAPATSRNTNSEARDGRQLGPMLDFIQRMFASNATIKTTSDQDKEIALKDIDTGFDNAALLPSVAHEVSVILKQRFTELLRDIPGELDHAVNVITEKQAKSNMLDYTVAAAFLFGAIFDSAGDFFRNERNYTEFVMNPEYVYLNGWLYAYAFGFGAPFWIGLENPRQDCNGVDFVDILDTLNFDLDRLSGLPDNQRYITTRKYRLLKEKKLFCITSKIDRYKEASEVNTKMDELLSIVSTYSTLRLIADSPAPEPDPLDEERAKEISVSIDELDEELQDVFQNFEQQISDAYDYAYSSRVSDNLVKIVIGIPNLIGMIFGILIAANNFDFDEVPALPDVPATLFNNTYNLTVNGQAANDFQIGEALWVMGAQGWGYGYYAPYFTRLEDPDPGCGIHDFMDLIRNHRDITSLRTLYGSPQDIILGNTRLSVNNLPDYVKYRLERFGGEMRVALHCLLSRVDKTSYDLLFSIESWLDLSIFRVDLTAELLNIL